MAAGPFLSADVGGAARRPTALVRHGPVVPCFAVLGVDAPFTRPPRSRRCRRPLRHAADGQAVRWPAGRATVTDGRTPHSPAGVSQGAGGDGLWPWLCGRSPKAELTDNRAIHSVPLSSRRLHPPSFPVRAPAPGARTLRRQAARRGRPQARRYGGERSAAFSRFAPGGRAPRMDHRLSEAPPHLWSSVRGGWHRAAGPRPRRACSRAALAPRGRRAGGVARAALAAAPRLRRLRTGRRAAYHA